MTYLTKAFAILIIFSSLCAQNSEPYRIGVDSKSKLKFMPSTSQKNIIETNIRSSFSKAIKLSKDYGWNISFEMIAQNMFDKIIEEQKIRENLEDCLDEKCAIKLGKLASAKYMIYRDIVLIGSKFSISFLLLNIETGEIQHSVDDYFEGQLFSRKGKEFLDDLMIQLFNGGFPSQDPLPSKNREVIFTPENQNPPIPDNQRVRTIHSKPREVRLTATDLDNDKLSFKLFSTRSKNGSLRIKNGNVLVYSPQKKFVGVDEVNFTVSDGLYSNTGKVIFNVYNNAPSSDNMSITVKQGESKVIYPRLYDKDGDLVQIKLGKVKPRKGGLTVRNDRIIYKPNSRASGNDKFSYYVTDSMNNSTEYNVSISIIAPKDSQNKKNDSNNSRINILYVLLLVVLVAAAGGGSSSGSGGSGTGIVDIGIIGP